MPARNDQLKDPSKKPLTKRQENFVNHLVYDNMTQREAYIAAGYSAKSKPVVIDKAACELLKLCNVLVRYNELMDERIQRDKTNAVWTRDMAVQANKGMYYDAINEKNRIEAAYEEELKMCQDRLLELVEFGDMEEARKVTDMITKLKKSKRLGMTSSNQARGAIDSLNRMMGFEKQVVEMEANIQFVGDKELED